MPSPKPTSLVRPYRSHRIPACDNCRYRKVRCVLDVSGQPCRCCRERNVPCNYVVVAQPPNDEQDQHCTLSKRQRTSYADSDVVGTRSPRRASDDPLSLTKTSRTESSVLMDPQMAEDITVLEQYLSQKTAKSCPVTKPYRTIATVSQNPIVYMTVPRIRKGLESMKDPGGTQREIIEQVLSPYAAEVRKLFFEYLHPCFPILDEQTFLRMWQKDKASISSTLMCDIYASALSYWHKSEALCRSARPDLNFVWNNAVTALQDDFLGPTMSTVHCALLDMVGRPVGAVTGNIVNAGRVVTLAQSLGLHRDPSSWKVTLHEKNVRIRLWWGVIIHDHWSSIGHGIPPNIDPKYYDVPLVTSDTLKNPAASKLYLEATSTFIELCKLTQILDNVLPHVYALQMDPAELWRCLRKTECTLDDWLSELPAHVIPTHSTNGLTTNGSSNLWFAYLAVKLLVCRLAVKATLKDTTSSSEARHYRLANLREASCVVIDFISSLRDVQLHEFWLPYTSYLLVTAATILLRCTIECGDLSIKKSCIAKLIAFTTRLRSARDECGWDLAEFCLERCEEPIHRFADALQITSQSQVERAITETTIAQTSAVPDILPESSTIDFVTFTDLFPQFDTLEHPCDTLWDLYDATCPTWSS